MTTISNPKSVSDWIDHDGGIFPGDENVTVAVRWNDGYGIIESGGFAWQFYWPHQGEYGDITQYRIVKP